MAVDSNVSSASGAARKSLPGPAVIPGVGNLLAFATDPLQMGLEYARRYGDVVGMSGLGIDLCLISHPADIERVLVKEHAKYVKDQFTHDLSDVLGRGLLVSEGDFWRRQRRLAQPAFHHERIAAYARIMVERTRELVHEWRSGEIRELRADMMRLTLDIVTRCLFSSDVGGDAERIGRALDAIMDNYLGVFETGFRLPGGWPTPGNRRFRAAIRQVDQIVRRIVSARRAVADTSGADAYARARRDGDLLDMLLAVRDEDGSAMSDDQVRDEVITLMLAGHETTALTLTYVFHLLGQHADAAQTLQAEVDEVLGTRPASLADVPRLQCADRIVQESMRLYPPAWAMGREPLEDVEIGGYTIRKGTQIQIMPYVVHRDPRWFDAPEEFRPERWTAAFVESLPRFAYFPFGGGPRVCIGNQFAKMEAILVLATLVQTTRFDVASPDPLPLVPSITMRPRRAVRAAVWPFRA